MINLINTNNKNYFLIKSIFIKTCIFFVAAYFIFHFINGNISLSPLADKNQLIIKSTEVLLLKEKELEFKELLISKLNNSNENMDLLDELVRLKLGYSHKDDLVFSIK